MPISLAIVGQDARPARSLAILRVSTATVGRPMQEVNRQRGSVAPAIKGRTFQDATEAWRRAIAPNLSPATVRQRESYLRVHVLPRFGTSAPHAVNVQQLQMFATELREKVSRKTIVNILSAVFAVLAYARKCGIQVSDVRFKDLELGSPQDPDVPFFTREQASQIINAAKEPYKTLRNGVVHWPACW